MPASLRFHIPRTRCLALTASVPLAFGGALVAVESAETASAAPLGPKKCISRDNGLPVIDDADFAPSSIDTTSGPKRVRLSVHAHDTGGPGRASGIAAFTVQVGRLSPGTAHYIDQGKYVRLTRSSVAHTFTGSFTVPRGAGEGEWGLSGYVLRDHAGNDVFDDDAEDDPIATRTESAILSAGLTVASAPDTEAPTVTSMSLSPKKVDTRKMSKVVRVTVATTDDMSGVAGVSVYAQRGRHSRQATLKDHGDGTFTGKLRIPRWQGTGTWKITNLTVVDRAGNRRPNFGANAPKELGEWTFDVRSRNDARKPKLVGVKAPKSLDVRRKSKVATFKVHLKDNRAGVARAELAFAERSVSLRRISGTGRNGVWKGRVRVDACAAVPARPWVMVTMHDRADNQREVLAKRVRVRSADHALADPRLSASSGVQPSGPVVVRFPEAVIGLTAQSAQIRERTGLSPLRPRYGNPIAGTWTCFNAAGTTVSCTKGKVRRASWAPAAGTALAPDTEHLVTLNPDGNLGVTDLAGNPYRRASLGLRTGR